MKKKIFIALTLIGVLSFIGCGGSDQFELSDGTTQKENFGESKDGGGLWDAFVSETDQGDPERTRFGLIDCDYYVCGGNSVDILVDQKTRVQYLVYKGNITALLNKDGTPLLYEGEVNYNAE